MRPTIQFLLIISAFIAQYASAGLGNLNVDTAGLYKRQDEDSIGSSPAKVEDIPARCRGQANSKSQAV